MNEKMEDTRANPDKEIIESDGSDMSVTILLGIGTVSSLVVGRRLVLRLGKSGGGCEVTTSDDTGVGSAFVIAVM